MTVAMAAIVAAHAENIGEAFTIVILAGLIQMMFGLLRIGRFVTYTPYSVISGFMTGVGVIIIVGQSLPFLGAPAVPGGTIATLLNFVDILDHFQISALGIAVVTLAVGLFWPDRFDKYLPSTLVALVVGNAFGGLLAYRRSGHRRRAYGSAGLSVAGPFRRRDRPRY